MAQSMELLAGKTAYSEGTFPCDVEGCCYHSCGRCIFNVARLQIRIGRACYEELREAEQEAYLDYLEGWG